MARKTNYGFEKRQKELKRQEKREAKEARKLSRREEGDAPDERDPAADGAEDESGGDHA